MPKAHTIDAMLALYDRELRREVEYPDMRKDVLPGLVRFVRPAPGMSFILHSQLEAGNIEAAIREQVAYFDQLGQSFEWKVFDYDQPPDLKERLLAAGFQPDEPEAIMALEIAHAPAELLAPIDADLRAIETREALRDIIAVLETVWSGKFDWVTERMGSHLLIPGYLKIYAAYVGDQPAASGWMYFHPGSQFASLWGGSTVAPFRKQGLYTALLAVRLQEALRRGRRFLVVDAGPMSQPILEKHGFRVLTHAVAYERRVA